MMKKALTLACAAMLTLAVSAQTVQEGVASIGDLSVPSCTVSLQKDTKLVKDAMEHYLKENQQLKVKNQQGYMAALNQTVATISPNPISLYTKVEEQGKKKDRSTVVTVCVIGNDLTVDQSDLRDRAKSWLAGFVGYISRYEALLSMNAEQANLKKAEKAAAAAAADLAAIEKSIASDQKKIQDKLNEIEKLKEKIKGCEQDIKDLEANIEKNGKKKTDAEQKVNEANQGVSDVEREVERYRQLAQ